MSHRAFVKVALVIALCALWIGAAPSGLARGDALDDPDVEVARKHFVLGSSRYAAGDYVGALAEFELAKRARPVAALDFNIARCLDRLERYSEAIVAYRLYVEAAPNAPDAGTVRERIALLEKRSTQVRPSPPAEPPPVPALEPTRAPTSSPANNVTAAPPASPQPSISSRYLVPGILTGVTGVTLVTGAALLGVLANKYDRANSAEGCRPCTDGEIAPLRRYQAAGYAMMGISGALLVVDVALFVVAARKTTRTTTATTTNK